VELTALRVCGILVCMTDLRVFALLNSSLLQLLLDANDPANVLMNSNVAHADPSSRIVELENGARLRGRVIVGADGVRSSVIRSVGIPEANFVGQAGYRGVAEFKAGLSPIELGTATQVRMSGCSDLIDDVM
jgi:2-polyprenyl-6-methoxyphenol hydroxylase-like FAD-dependent oxidoreductase